MKTIFIVSILFLSLFSSENDTVKMEWDASQPLTWADFQGVPSGGTEYVASTNSGISFTFSYARNEQGTKLTFDVKSYFYPKLSWYKKGSVSDYILGHEQTHFDISELHARILRKRLAEKDFSEDHWKEEIEAIYQDNEVNRKEMQERFDRESDHSKIKENELLWEAFVAKQLITYDRWQ